MGLKESMKRHPAGKRDAVNSPAHYTQFPVEVIELTEHLDFLSGNVVKYVVRAPFKGNRVEDLRKAEWYLKRLLANSGVELFESITDDESLSWAMDKAVKQAVAEEQKRIIKLIETLRCPENGIEHNCVDQMPIWTIDQLIAFIKGENK